MCAKLARRGRQKHSRRTRSTTSLRHAFSANAKGLPGKEELEAFHKWQDDQKSAEQKSAEAIKVQSDRATQSREEGPALEASCSPPVKGVKPDAADDVVALASLKVSDDMPLEKRQSDEVLKKYPQFAGGSAPTTTGVSGGNGSAAISGVEAAFRAKNPGIKF